jgi:hypothetical protein
MDKVQDALIFGWDIILTIFNSVTPNYKPGHVIPQGKVGFNGEWPEYVAPKEGDSRSACPALNALANHGTKTTHHARARS